MLKAPVLFQNTGAFLWDRRSQPRLFVSDRRSREPGRDRLGWAEAGLSFRKEAPRVRSSLAARAGYRVPLELSKPRCSSLQHTGAFLQSLGNHATEPEALLAEACPTVLAVAGLIFDEGLAVLVFRVACLA